MQTTYGFSLYTRNINFCYWKAPYNLVPEENST